MENRLNVAILFGGNSVEHRGSVQSARNLYLAINKEKYNLIFIGVDINGKWVLYDETYFSNIESEKIHFLPQVEQSSVAIIPGSGGSIIDLVTQKFYKIDVFFPMVHGGIGENGVYQGALESLSVPYVGAGVLGSGIGMDKEVMKRLLLQSGIAVGKFLTYTKDMCINYNEVKSILGDVFFVKPASLGSSVGISKISNVKQFEASIKNALIYDNKILFEECIDGREIECAVIGNKTQLKPSVLGEVIINKRKFDYYSFQAKYVDPDGAVISVPANVDLIMQEKLQILSMKIFELLECNGMARVDFFVKDDGSVFVNEINTIPGFTTQSMFIKLWEHSGLSYSDLVEKLINLAIDKFDNCICYNNISCNTN